MIRVVSLKRIVPLGRAPTWEQCRMGLGLESDGLNHLSTRFASSTSPPHGNDDVENRRKLLVQRSKTRREEAIVRPEINTSERPLRKWALIVTASSCVLFMVTLGYMAYSPSFRTFQRTESPRISWIADIILGVETDGESDSDTGPSIEYGMKRQRFRDLQRQRENAQCSADSN